MSSDDSVEQRLQKLQKKHDDNAERLVAIVLPFARGERASTPAPWALLFNLTGSQRVSMLTLLKLTRQVAEGEVVAANWSSLSDLAARNIQAVSDELDAYEQAYGVHSPDGSH